MKLMDLNEFVEAGYLQELNRQFLHPLGLALVVAVGSAGAERLHGIWDVRDAPEGIIFDPKSVEEDVLHTYQERCRSVMRIAEARREGRFKAVGT